MEVVSQEYAVYKLKEWHPEWLPSFFNRIGMPGAASEALAIYRKERRIVMDSIVRRFSSKAQV